MKGIPVVDGNWREALQEAIRRRHEHQGDDGVVTIISPNDEQEVLNDDKQSERPA